MTADSRRFRVAAGRHVVLPVELLPGPGATNMRFEGGEVFELEGMRVRAHARYLNNRKAIGDLVEDDTSTPPATGRALANVTPTRAPAGDVVITTGAPPAKD